MSAQRDPDATRNEGAIQRIPPEKWMAYFEALSRGEPRYKAAKLAGFTVNTADRLHNNPRSSSGWPFYRQWLKDNVHDVIPDTRLTPNAKRAKKDFEFFRRRYFGHVSRPWHVEAANRVIDLLNTDQKSYVVVNCPPGSGKSTLFTHDIPLWALVRNRSLRILIGTYAETIGDDYVFRIKTSLERTDPVEADEVDRAMGLAIDARSTLVHDFGRFKPDGNGYWRSDKIVVAREGGVPAHQKEASVAAAGRKSSFLGMRYNLVIWDDVVTDQNSRTPAQQEELARWWRSTAESRLEPGGLMILQGQRMGPHDLYRHALDLRDISEHYEDDENFDPERLPRKYQHVIFKAHYEEKCKGEGRGDHHDPGTAEPYPKGCLLDPQRLTYRDLRMARFNDAKNYATVYQQEDTDPSSVLVNPLWISGGTDANGTIFPGCWDPDRQVGQWPTNLAGDVYSVVTADPSATNFWGVQWWAYQADTGFQHLIDLTRKRMQAPDLLDWNQATGRFTGLLEDLWQHSQEIGHPITHVIVETNAAQRFLLQYDHAKRWSMTRRVDLTSHQTQRNKSDPEMGVGMLGPEYRHGRVRLPGHPLTRVQVLPLYNEVTRYPDSATTDCVMAHWFLLWQAQNLFAPKRAEPYSFDRPSWMRDRERGLRAV